MMICESNSSCISFILTAGLLAASSSGHRWQCIWSSLPTVEGRREDLDDAFGAKMSFFHFEDDESELRWRSLQSDVSRYGEVVWKRYGWRAMIGCDNLSSDARGWVPLNGVKFTSGLHCGCPGPSVVLIVVENQFFKHYRHIQVRREYSQWSRHFV